MGEVIEDGFDFETGSYVTGNPGKGNLSFFPKLFRKYGGLEFTFEKSRGKINFFLSYVLSKTYGNYPGLYDADYNVGNPNISPIDFVEQTVNATGLLPNDRPHVLKFFGSYNFNFGLSMGATFYVMSGTPINEFGAIPFAAEFKKFLSERGSVGRTPSIWDGNIRLKYDLGMLTKSNFGAKLIVDIFHLFSPRKAVILDQQHFSGADPDGNQIGENPNYLNPLLYQLPMMLRVGFEIDF